MVLEGLEAGEGSAAGNELVAEAGLVLILTLVHLLVGVVRLTCRLLT